MHSEHSPLEDHDPSKKEHLLNRPESHSYINAIRQVPEMPPVPSLIQRRVIRGLLSF